MTDQEIIKALRCCASIASCYKCPFQTEMICRAMLKSAAADRLEELTENRSSVMMPPAADVAPVRHGRWMNANSRPKTYWRRCTACGGLSYFCGIGCSYKYCPNCGAKMDGGADNG